MRKMSSSQLFNNVSHTVFKNSATETAEPLEIQFQATGTCNRTELKVMRLAASNYLVITTETCVRDRHKKIESSHTYCRSLLSAMYKIIPL